MAEGTTYFKATIDMDGENRNVQVEIGPNLQFNDAIMSTAVIINGFVKAYGCSINDLIVEIAEKSLKMQRERVAHEKEVSNTINGRYIN